MGNYMGNYMAITCLNINRILTRGQAPCEIRTSLRLGLDDITARRQRHYGSPATTLRLVVTLLLMMVVGVSGVKADEPVEITTADDITNGTKKLYLIQTNQFQSFYMIPKDNNVTTVNLPNDQMLWYFMDAGTVEENGINVQYYYIVSNSLEKYIYNSDYASKGRTIKLGNFDSNSVEKFMFKLVVDDTKGTTGFYNIDIKPNGGSWLGLNKQGGSVSSKNNIRLTNDDSNHYIHDYSSKWKFIRFNGTLNFPDPLSPFALSTNTEKHYFKIRNKQNTNFYMSTNSSNPQMVTYANTGNDGMVWYFKEAGSDGWFKYYYIINQEADDQYMYYEGTTSGSGMTENAVSLKAKSPENEDHYQFVIVQAAKVDKSNKDAPLECYTIIPKSLNGILWDSNSLGSSSIENDNTMGIIEGRAKEVTDNNNSHWTFEPITPCADPTITFDETTKKVTISNTTTGASVYYTTTGENPTRTSTLYDNGITLTENASTTIKAVTVKDGNARSNVVTKTFIYMPTITLAGGPYIYDGEAKTPSISSVMVGETSISTSDYDVSYENNTNAGTATVTIRGKTGNETLIFGTADFTIAKADINPTVSITGWTYGTPNDPSVSGNTGNGTVAYQYKVKGSGDETYSDEKPTDVGTYLVKAIIAESTNYNGSTTEPVEFTISKAILDLTVSITGWTYGGSANSPSVSGIPGSVTATYSYKVQGADDSSYSEIQPTDAGDYTVRVTIAATDNYESVEATTDFTISPKNLGNGTDAAMDIDIKMTQVGDNVEVTYVKDGEKTLEENKDYIVEIQTQGDDNHVIVTGIGNYGGSVQGLFVKSVFTKPTGVTEAAAVYQASSDLAKPNGITPYIVRKVNPSIGTIVISPIDYIPKDVPVLMLRTGEITGFLASPKDENISEITAQTKNSNLLKVAPTGGVEVESAQVYSFYKGEFVLTKKGTLSDGKFYIYNPNYPTTPPAEEEQQQGGGNAPSLSTLRFVIEEDPTGIVEMSNEKGETRNGSAWYTLDGRKLNGQPTKAGLYIKNGRKTVIKRK